jgi:intein/homing endonuclease
VAALTEEKGKLTVLEEEPLSERELAEATKLLSSLLARGGAEAAVEAGLAAAQEEIRAVAEELERLSRKLLPEVAELDLGAMAGYLFGITDPIGQIQAWFAERFREMAAWFSSAVQGIFKDFWDKIISPVLGGVRFVVDAIKSTLDGVAQQVAGLASSIISGVMGALAPLLEGARSFLGSLIQGVAAGVASLASQVGSLFSSLASQIGSVASAVASGFASLASRLGDVARGILDAVGRVGAAVGEAFGKLADLVSRSLGELAGRVLGAVQTIASMLTGLFERVVGSLAGLGDLVARGFAGLAQSISGVAQAVARVVAPIAEAVARALDPIADMVGRGFAAMGEWMAKASQSLLQVGVSIQGFVNAVLHLPERIRGFFEWIKEAIEGVRRAIEGFFRDPIGAIRAALRDIGEWIWKALPGWLRDAVELLASFFRELRESLGSSPIDLRGFFKGVFDWLAQQIWNMLPDWLRGAIQALQDFADWLRRSLEDFARDPMGFLQRGFTWLAQQIWEHLPEPARGALQALKGWLDEVWRRLGEFAESARRALEDFAKWIWEHLPEPLKWFLERVREFFEQAWRGIVWFFTEAAPNFFSWLWQQLQEFARDPAGYVYRGFQWLGEEIWKRLPDPVKWFFERVREFFEWAWSGLVWLFSEGLPNFFRWLWERVQEFWRDPIGSISRGLYWVGEQIWKLLPDPLKQFITWVRGGLEWLWQQFLEFVRDPIGAIQSFFAWLAERVMEGLKWIADVLWKGVEAVFRWLGGALAGFVELLYRVVVEPMRGIAESIGRAALDALEWIVGVGRSAVERAVETIKSVLRAGLEEGKRLLLETVLRVVGGGGGGEVDLALTLSGIAILLSFVWDWGASVCKYFSHLTERVFVGYVASMGVRFGIITVDNAIKKVFGIYTRPARILYELGEFLHRLADSMRHWFFELVPRGLAAVIEPAFMYAWRQGCDFFGLEDLPLSAPALPLVVTALQRLGIVEEAGVGGEGGVALPAPPSLGPMPPARVTAPPPVAALARRVSPAEVFHRYLMYRGYPKWFREVFTGAGEWGDRAKVEVVDRFGQTRTIPLAMVFEMPTPGEVAEMMVKDAFASFDDYKRWAARLGVPESVAVFNYFLRFRYPDPRFLWTFALRAAANMLWFRQTPEMKGDAERDARPIGAYIPADPADFNGRGGEAFRILVKYLKWQDYASFAWDAGWPSDAGIIADALADIPSKIDARWMCVPPGTIVLGDNKPIETYRIGDATLYGGRVLETFARPYRGDLVVIKGLGLLPIKVTPEHPVLVVEGEIRWRYYRRGGKTVATHERVFSEPFFVEAEGVQPAPVRSTARGYVFRRRGHYLVVPRLRGEYDIREVDLSKYYKCYSVVPRRVRERLGERIPRLILDEDTAWMLGFYVGDGSVFENRKGGCVRFYPASGEHVARLVRVIERYGGRPMVYKYGNSYMVVWYNTAVKRFLAEHFGDRAYNRHIPDFVLLHKDEGVLRAFLQGYLDADGHRYGSRGQRYEAVTVSKVLALQLQLLCFRLGYVCSITPKNEPQAGYAGEAYRLTIELERDEKRVKIRFAGDYVLVPVVEVSREPYEGYVYNLETERNVYLVSNAIVHNCKWGLLDLLGELGVGATSPPEAIATALEGGGARGAGGPEMKMDVELLCKFLMAGGLHPYYVPLSAIAEAMNALSEERTMVRTGVQNLYERGLITLRTARSLLSGIGVVRFKVAYAAPPNFTWKSFDFGVPIRFLEPEVHLTLVRSAMDRYLEVYGKAVSEVARGVRELAISPEDGEKLLKKYAEAIGARLNATLGGELGLRAEVAPDEEYFKAWLEYAQLTADIETVYRLRLLAQRILGWVIYRVATGYVTGEELERVLATLETHFNFTKRELDAVRALAAAVNDIAVRETERSTRARVALEEAVPTLGTLAAMAEYVEVPMGFVRQVLAERRVTGTYAELWIRYLVARTIAREVDTLSSTYRRWVENFAEPVGVGEAIRELMRAGGWTDRELAIYDVDLYLRRAFRVMSLLTPTVRQFVGDALYLSDWERYLEDLLRARGVDLERYKRQVEYYKTLIRNRRLRARVNAYITELVNAYAEGVITEDELRGELEYLKGYGLVDEEVEIVTWIAELRRARRLARRR